MEEIEAKIIQKTPGTFAIICPNNNQNPLLKELIKSFSGLIGLSDSYSTENGNPVLLLVHEPKEMQKDQNRVNLLGQDKLMSQGLKPIIHFLKDNRYLKSLYSKEKLNKEQRREYEVMDNSIWNYLVPMTDLQEAGVPKQEDLLKDAIEAISDHYKKDLYRLEVTYEYADWNARLFKQSFLKGSHALDVSPHVFHSESAIYQLLKDDFISNDKLSSFKGDKMKWRFLLVDDYAMKKLRLKTFNQEGTLQVPRKKSALFKNIKNDNLPRSTTSRVSDKSKVSKGEIIEDLLKKRGFNIVHRQWDDNNKVSSADIMIEYAENLADAKKALSHKNGKEYDIILLDYLLDEKSLENSRNYGYELLEDIKNNSKEYRIGPSKQLFFIFMSAFSSAVQGRLLSQGLNQSESYWYIDTGACPTNTPQLFTYSLLQLMEKRLDDSGIWSLTSDEILRLINVIFRTPKTPLLDVSSVRTRARDNYHEVLRLHYNFRKILQEVEVPEDYDEKESPGKLFNTTGSVLASYFMLKNQNLGGLLEHLVQLVHLAAFGTIRQWAEMWEEYIYIRAHFEERGFSVKDNNFRQMCEHIENFIFDLKSQQR